MRAFPLSARGKAGFTLIEVAIAVAIAGLLASAFFQYMTVQMKRERFETTKRRMEFVQKTLATYATHNKKLPCPDGSGAAQTWESGCRPGMKAAPGIRVFDIDAGHKAEDGSNEIWIGVLPILELGLTPEQAKDGWGNYLTYAVSRRLTFEDSLKASKIDPPHGIIRLVNERKGDVLKGYGAQFVIVSHGPTGAGSWHGAGDTGKGRKPCNNQALDKENCNNDNVFMAAPYSEGTEFFDDIVMYDFPLEDDSSIMQLLLCNARQKFYTPDTPGADKDGCSYPENSWNGGCVMTTTSRLLESVDPVTGDIRQVGWELVSQETSKVLAPAISVSSSKTKVGGGSVAVQSCSCRTGYIVQPLWYNHGSIFYVPVTDGPRKGTGMEARKVDMDYYVCLRDSLYVPPSPNNGSDKKLDSQ